MSRDLQEGPTAAELAPDLARLMAAAPDLLAHLARMTDLAEEACAWREESADPEDKEMLPFYQAEVAAARGMLSALRRPQ